MNREFRSLSSSSSESSHSSNSWNKNKRRDERKSYNEENLWKELKNIPKENYFVLDSEINKQSIKPISENKKIYEAESNMEEKNEDETQSDFSQSSNEKEIGNTSKLKKASFTQISNLNSLNISAISSFQFQSKRSSSSSSSSFTSISSLSSEESIQPPILIESNTSNPSSPKVSQKKKEVVSSSNICNLSFGVSQKHNNNNNVSKQQSDKALHNSSSFETRFQEKQTQTQNHSQNKTNFFWNFQAEEHMGITKESPSSSTPTSTPPSSFISSYHQDSIHKSSSPHHDGIRFDRHHDGETTFKGEFHFHQEGEQKLHPIRRRSSSASLVRASKRSPKIKQGSLQKFTFFLDENQSKEENIEEGKDNSQVEDSSSNNPSPDQDLRNSKMTEESNVGILVPEPSFIIKPGPTESEIIIDPKPNYLNVNNEEKCKCCCII